MNCNTDGFNERNFYIHKSTDLNKLRQQEPSKIDSSFAQMKSEENRDIVTTTNQDAVIVSEEARGTKENFVLRNNAMSMANKRPLPNNPLNQAMQRNMFKK